MNDIERLIRAALPDVPGLSITEVMIGERLSNPPKPYATIVAAGWSPTLNARVRRWDVDTGPDAADPLVPWNARGNVGHRVAHRLRDPLKAQADLAEAASRNGIAAPVATPPGGWPRIGHIHVATASLDLLADRLGPGQAARHIAERLTRLTDAHPDRDDFVMDPDGDIAGVLGGVPAMHIMQRIGDTATLRGRILTVRQDVPDTLIEALAGRCVSALAATGIAPLDAAAIEGHERDERDGSVVLTLDLPSIRIADHRLIGPVLVDGSPPPRSVK